MLFTLTLTACSHTASPCGQPTTKGEIYSMTLEQKRTIHTLRSQGVSMPKISAELDMSVNTVKAFLRREQKNKEYCKNCHRPLEQIPGRKPKTFSGDVCRNDWWKNHRDQIVHKVVYQATCAHCGQDFESYGKGRKYCGHPCYIAARFGVP